MSYMADIGSYLAAGSVNQMPKGLKVETQEDKMGLDMTDFLTLMVTELKNQSIDQTADTSDMLNQLVQMQMVQALVNMTDASVMSYAASLVGKEVTVAQYDADGNLQEVVGVVTGTGKTKLPFLSGIYFRNVWKSTGDPTERDHPILS